MHTTVYSSYSGQPIQRETLADVATAVRPCRIHRGGPEHVHRTACAVCLRPLDHGRRAGCSNSPVPVEPREVRWLCVERAA